VVAATGKDVLVLAPHPPECRRRAAQLARERVKPLAEVAKDLLLAVSMLAGGDLIEDTGVVCGGATSELLDVTRAPSTIGTRRLKDLSVAVGRASGPLSQELGRAPRPSELAAYLRAPVEEVIEALDAQANRQAGALDAVDPQTGSPAVEGLGDYDEELEWVEYRHALRPLLDELPERERTILMLRFFGEMTQTQIAERIGISQMHVSRLLSRTLTQLRVQLLDHPQTE
jgi:RNA polymerase sigma factor (sigma-70 family)